VNPPSQEPYIRVEETGAALELRPDATTIGRGRGVDVVLTDPSVSALHAEIVRRGPYVYVADMGLSRLGTLVNGRPVTRRVLHTGDVVAFGLALCRMGGIPCEELADAAEMSRPPAAEVTRRELDILAALCRPALSGAAFVDPATAREIADELGITEAAVKQHLGRLYRKFRIPTAGYGRRARLANEVIAQGIIHPAAAT
jgi:hypothetical protein